MWVGMHAHMGSKTALSRLNFFYLLFNTIVIAMIFDFEGKHFQDSQLVAIFRGSLLTLCEPFNNHQGHAIYRTTKIKREVAYPGNMIFKGQKMLWKRGRTTHPLNT